MLAQETAIKNCQKIEGKGIEVKNFAKNKKVTKIQSKNVLIGSEVQRQRVKLPKSK